jgi:aminoglycoside phosphotransferase (APT) family kinase protein
VDLLLARLEDLLGSREGEPVALAGGITNRNFRVRLGGEDYVIRLCGPNTDLLGIDREAERAACEAAHLAGVGPAVVAFLPDDDCLVFAFVAGRAVEAADVRAGVERVAAALRAVHASGPVAAVFSPFRVAERYRATTLARGGALPDGCADGFRVAAEIERALGAPEVALCHNDLLPANLLDAGGRLWIVDWEYAGMGDAAFDLGNLSVNNGFALADDERLVAAYYGAADERRLARLRLMRVASDWREAMWGVVQGTLSDLDFDFAGYADEHLRRMLASDWEEWVDGAAA